MRWRPTNSVVKIYENSKASACPSSAFLGHFFQIINKINRLWMYPYLMSRKLKFKVFFFFKIAFHTMLWTINSLHFIINIEIVEKCITKSNLSGTNYHFSSLQMPRGIKFCFILPHAYNYN